ncbi:MAG: hypothetical protein ACKOCT_15860, partial [Alphaproteobacteria bacterium]
KADLDLDGGRLSDTAFGGWMSRHYLPLAGAGLGNGATAGVLVAVLVAVACVAIFTRASRVGCYWAGIVVTHPLGAALGDFMTKDDGLDLGNARSTAILAAVFAAVGWVARRRERAIHAG